MIYFMENPIKNGMIWGYPYFRKHPNGEVDRWTGSCLVVFVFSGQKSSEIFVETVKLGAFIGWCETEGFETFH